VASVIARLCLLRSRRRILFSPCERSPVANAVLCPKQMAPQLHSLVSHRRRREDLGEGKCVSPPHANCVPPRRNSTPFFFWKLGIGRANFSSTDYFSPSPIVWFYGRSLLVRGLPPVGHVGFPPGAISHAKALLSLRRSAESGSRTTSQPPFCSSSRSLLGDPSSTAPGVPPSHSHSSSYQANTSNVRELSSLKATRMSQHP